MFEKNEQEVSQIIEENLEELLSRKISIEEVLRQHPRHAADLRRELEPAIWLASHRECVQPRPGFIPASRKRVAERVKEEAFSREGKRPGLALARPSRRLAFQIVAVFLIAALLLGGVSGAVSAAQNALPGEQWYGVKRFGESVAFHLAINDVRRVELEMQLVGRGWMRWRRWWLRAISPTLKKPCAITALASARPWQAWNSSEIRNRQKNSSLANSSIKTYCTRRVAWTAWR